MMFNNRKNNAANAGQMQYAQTGMTQQAPVQMMPRQAAPARPAQPQTKGRRAGFSKRDAASAATTEFKERPDRIPAPQFMQKIAGIEALPNDVTSTLPFRGFMENGVIETTPGTFTKSYRLKDVSFRTVKDEEQMQIYKDFIAFLNSFPDYVRWEITTFSHEIDKRKVVDDITIKPARDGLNKYRREVNQILFDNLKKGSRLIKQEKILTIAVTDPNVDHAMLLLEQNDREISSKLGKITGGPTYPMTTKERMELLYDIYNIDSDYRLATGIYDDEPGFNIGDFEKAGISLKDAVGPGPSGFDFSKSNYFMVGDMYARSMVLYDIPPNFSTEFIQNLNDLKFNMLLSTYTEAPSKSDAVKLVKHKMADINADISSKMKASVQEVGIADAPQELADKQAGAADLLNDVTNRNQSLFFITLTITVFARTREELEEETRQVTSASESLLCHVKTLKFQQEFCFNTCLPLCRNDINMSILYTSESAGVFLPFDSQEVKQKDAIFYGLDSTTKSMILYDRTSGDNFNGLIFGGPGSGKSFLTKFEMISVLLKHPDAQVFVIDPQGEYYPIAQAFGGQVIELTPGNNVFMNPLDLDISTNDDEPNPIVSKSDFVLSMFDILAGKNMELSPEQKSILDRCVQRLYSGYVEDLQRNGKTIDRDKAPTLSDLYRMLRSEGEVNYGAKSLADVLSQYTIGSFNTFAKRTNIDTNSRFIVYDTKRLGTGMKELGLHICNNDVYSRMIQNSKNNRYTWFYIDEFHVLLESPATTLFLKKIWKMARKWMGVPTGIMQNTEDLITSKDTRAIFDNTSFIMMMKSSKHDRDNLGQLLGLSDSQLEYITNSEKGTGLFSNGRTTLPFELKVPKNTELYKLMTTQHDVEGAVFK